MSNRESLLQRPALGSAGSRWLSLSVLAISLSSIVGVVLFVAPNARQPAPALIADLSTEIAGTAQARTATDATRTPASAPVPAVHDPAIAEHEALDPVGAGRYHAP